MKELFIPFVIPDLELIQTELLAAIDHDYKANEKPHAFSYYDPYMMDRCPFFMSWLRPRLKMPVRMYRYYITPPKSKLAVHIDGVNPTVPFAVNIPLAGTKNTFHSYYETTADNITYKTGPGYLGAAQPIDYSKLKKIVDLEIVTPHITNNSVLHGVTNDTDQHRVMFTIRWIVDSKIARTVQECMEISDLLEPVK
jgi:hypothetical protein